MNARIRANPLISDFFLLRTPDKVSLNPQQYPDHDSLLDLFPLLHFRLLLIILIASIH